MGIESQAAGAFVAEALAQNIKTSDVYAEAAPRSARAMGLGTNWLKSCKSYRIQIPLIPYGGEERVDATLSRFAHGLIMPAPIVAIEYEHGGIYDMKPDLTRALATRRISLCVDLSTIQGIDAESSEGFRREFDDHGGVLVWSINYFDEKREWEMAPGIAVVPRFQARKHLSNSNRLWMLRGAAKKILRRGLDESDQMVVTHHEMFPEICEKLGEGHRVRVVRESNMDALWAALGFFSSFGCKNTVQNQAGNSILVSGKGDSLIPLDPFHGMRKRSWSGAYWSQGSRFNVEKND